MPQDAFTLYHTAKELDALLADAKINKVSEPDKDDVYLLAYTAKGLKTVVLSANAENCRVGICSKEKPNPKVAPNFCMLLRKHLLGATIKSVSLVGFERIVEIVFACKNDFRENVVKTLYCEIMGKYSNLILTENGVILGCLKNAPLDVATTRVTLAGAAYAFPKPQDKADPTNEGETIKTLSAYSGGDRGEFLFKNIKGLSYVTAAECAARMTATSPEKAYAELKKFLFSPEISPNICGEGKTRDAYIADYSTISGEKKYFCSVAEAADELYTAKESAKAFNLKQKQLADKVNGLIKKLGKKLQGESEKISAAESADEMRLKGELITANLWRIKQGESQCVIENYYDDNKPVTIALDKNISPNANAQRYFKKYAKEKRTLEILLPQRKKTESDLDYLSGVSLAISQAANIEDFKDIEDELIAFGLLPAPKYKIKTAAESPYRVYKIDGFTVKCGKNNVQNDRLTGRAYKEDMWLHAKGYHSSHVIIETDGVGIPDKVIVVAAEICAFYSDAKSGNKVPVDYTLKKFVKKPSGAKPGSVIYTDYKTCLVDPAAHEEFRV
ncbi:MAG: NFACT family protein [Clostridia bacterium]|nr:NFACT family protein [Clostridia bacterium]